MSKTNLQFDQDLISELELTPECIALFEKVLDTHPSQVLLTDLSSLSDFVGRGMPASPELDSLPYREYIARWDRWVIEKVRFEFGYELARTTQPLVQVIQNMRRSAAPAPLH